MKKLISFVVVFAAFTVAPSSLAADSNASDSLKLGIGAVSSVPKSSIKCGDVAQTDKGDDVGAAAAQQPLSKTDRVRASWSSSAKE